MPRRSSGGRSTRAPARAPAHSPPAPVKAAPPPAPAGGSVPGGIGSTMAEGMAFGAGNAVAHKAADAVMGPRTFRHETVPSAVPEAAAQCINSSGSDIGKCQFYMDMLSECKKSSGLAS